MKAIREVGAGRIFRFVWTSVLLVLFRAMWLPPLRAGFLRLCGARIGSDAVIHSVRLINVDRGGFRALTIGRQCFVGDEVLLDLAAGVVLEDQVTLAARAMILTHMNVGYQDHPLQGRYPSKTAPVVVRRASFIGAGATILAGCTVGPEAFVAACALVNRDVHAGESVRGVPIAARGGAAVT